jgi:hypothetical protein
MDKQATREKRKANRVRQARPQPPAEASKPFTFRHGTDDYSVAFNQSKQLAFAQHPSLLNVVEFPHDSAAPDRDEELLERYDLDKLHRHFFDST